MINLILAFMLAVAVPVKDAPRAAPEQCTTIEVLTTQLRPGTTLMREFTGADASRLNQALGGPSDITIIRVYVNSALPDGVWIVGFGTGGCMVAEGIIRRVDYDAVVRGDST